MSPPRRESDAQLVRRGQLCGLGSSAAWSGSFGSGTGGGRGGLPHQCISFCEVELYAEINKGDVVLWKSGDVSFPWGKIHKYVLLKYM